MVSGLKISALSGHGFVPLTLVAKGCYRYSAESGCRSGLPHGVSCWAGREGLA